MRKEDFDDPTSMDIPVGAHKDFHLLDREIINYLEDNYGEGERDAFLRSLATTVYAPLLEEVRRTGLSAIRAHFEKIFEVEQGKCTFEESGGTLVMRVTRCPAVWHLVEKGQPPSDSFCEQTRVVLRELCRLSGVDFEVDFHTESGTCVQTFSGSGRTRG